jgi:anti-anti-sigma factor
MSAHANRSMQASVAHGRAVLSANGRIDTNAAAAWDRCFSDVLDGHPRSVQLDLAAVTSVGEGGLKLLTDLARQFNDAGIEFAVVNVPVDLKSTIDLAAN